ncbi:MAG: hypothetical protein PHF56_23085 [Desulfuromonadaceae bacterium]|nr:hypothetical protein [Desulfuromonadaceae bacterium]
MRLGKNLKGLIYLRFHHQRYDEINKVKKWVRNENGHHNPNLYISTGLPNAMTAGNDSEGAISKKDTSIGMRMRVLKAGSSSCFPNPTRVQQLEVKFTDVCVGVFRMANIKNAGKIQTYFLKDISCNQR